KLRREAVVEAGARREHKVLLGRIESQQARPARAGERLDGVQQERCGRGQIRRFRQGGKEREMPALLPSRRRRDVSCRIQSGRHPQSAFSSLSLMFTKLYGGHGPLYLKDSTS